MRSMNISGRMDSEVLKSTTKHDHAKKIREITSFLTNFFM